MNWAYFKKFWMNPGPKVKPYSPENPPAFLEDRRIYVCHGENHFGNCITCLTDGDPAREHVYSVAGWLAWAPFPRIGDELLMQMGKGGWGRYVFAEVQAEGDPNDMFTGKVFGAYGLSNIEPATEQCDEFINRPAGGVVFRA